MKKYLALALMALALVWSCSKDDDSPNALTPKITKFSPPSGPVGTVVTIEGQNFSATAAENTVKIGTATATISSATATTLVVTVPAGATNGKVSVTVGGKTATGDTFTVTETKNLAPVFGTGSLDFEKPENITDAEVIGTVTANDPDGNGANLIFEIVTNTTDNLFVINELGEISLAEGMSLDYEGTKQYVIKVSVSDGQDITTADVTITVTNIIEPGELAASADSFITTWNIPEDGFELVLGTLVEYEYDFTIDWGDGTIENITLAVDDAQPTHMYATAGERTVALQGEFPTFVMYENVPFSTRISLKSMDQWGAIEWKSLSDAFTLAIGMKYNATDAPNLSQTTSLASMFGGIASFDAEAANAIGQWDVSNITDMSAMFGSTKFNGDLSGWNVSKVEDMSGMFSNAASFNQDLGDWTIGSVTDMTNMLKNSAMSPANFANTLIGWSKQVVQPGVELGCDNVDFCLTQESFDAVDILQSAPNNWTFSYTNGINCP
ncbi:BspA family leucine-rich repeat surface protein [Allomuricauda sp. NBRC 101325]|uniref:BspA family leucine-rich repeat surface protein n=1 Tax=Allomuricauda sp. NBRC 101325 TaxID=1113758 RepID=UPI0025562058|nr:BspA family leucine-rich repeat surface protein [Muricauda sp. NBRC 101325]